MPTYSCIVMDRRSITTTIHSRGRDPPKKVVDVNVYVVTSPNPKLEVCDEQIEIGGMFWPMTMKVCLNESWIFLS